MWESCRPPTNMTETWMKLKILNQLCMIIIMYDVWSISNNFWQCSNHGKAVKNESKENKSTFENRPWKLRSRLSKLHNSLSRLQNGGEDSIVFPQMCQSISNVTEHAHNSAFPESCRLKRCGCLCVCMCARVCACVRAVQLTFCITNWKRNELTTNEQVR